MSRAAYTLDDWKQWTPWLVGAGVGAVILAFAWPKKAGAMTAPPYTPPLPTGSTGGTVMDRALAAGMVFPPSSAAATTLFTNAARSAGLPDTWGGDSNLHSLLAAESGGWVGRPNYHFGTYADLASWDKWPEVWAAIRAGTWRNMILDQYKSSPSSATGLGQLTVTNLNLKNADGSFKYYPSSIAGIGKPLEEAIGMLKYIKDRYQTPAAAWAFHKEKHWY